MFSARQPPENRQLPAPLVPDDLPRGAAYQQLVGRITSNEIIRGKLLSNDGKLTLIVLALDPDAVQSDRLSRSFATFTRRWTPIWPEPASMPASPASRHATRDPQCRRARPGHLQRGRVRGRMLIAILFFRRASFMVIAAGPPLIAILLGLGALGWLDFRLNLFLNIMTPLIMVISFSDSMQLTFAARDRLIAGRKPLRCFPQRDPRCRTRVRPDPRNRRAFIHRAAIFAVRSDRVLRRGRLNRDRSSRL